MLFRIINGVKAVLCKSLGKIFNRRLFLSIGATYCDYLHMTG